MIELDELKIKYDRLQNKYGSKKLDSIYYGGQDNNPDMMFVFMNPTGRNIASSKEWKGIKAPWLGTKNIWKLFFQVGLLDEDIYLEIINKKSSDWDYEFANKVYDNVKKYNFFITNLGKCTQDDARIISDDVYKKYLKLLFEEIEIVKPKIIILLGNQVSSIVLNEKISVSEVRKKEFIKRIRDNDYRLFSVYYPVGNGIFNMDKSIEDIKYIISKYIDKKIISIKLFM